MFGKEKEREEVLTDKFAIHFFELKKVGKRKRNKRMEDWLTLINAETEGDLMALQQSTTIPEIQKTIVILREMSADEQIREEARRREKGLHDEATALNFARKMTQKMTQIIILLTIGLRLVKIILKKNGWKNGMVWLFRQNQKLIMQK